jgi:hypothetical protein
LDWFATNYHGGSVARMPGDDCTDTIQNAEIDVSDGPNIDTSGFIEVRAKHTRWQMGERTGSFGGLGEVCLCVHWAIVAMAG